MTVYRRISGPNAVIKNIVDKAIESMLKDDPERFNRFYESYKKEEPNDKP